MESENTRQLRAAVERAESDITKAQGRHQGLLIALQLSEKTDEAMQVIADDNAAREKAASAELAEIDAEGDPVPVATPA